MTSTISYDNKYDVFYMRPNPFVPSYGDEYERGITLLKSIDDDSVVGMIVMDFVSRMTKGVLRSEDLPLPIDFNNPYVASILTNTGLH